MDSSRATLYLPGTVPFQFSEILSLKELLVLFFQDMRTLHADTRVVSVKMSQLSEAVDRNQVDFVVRRSPRTFLGLLALAADEVIGNCTEKKIQVQITDWNNCRTIGELRPEDSNQIFKIRGIVTVVSTVKTIVTQGRVKCRRCGKEYEIKPNTKLGKCPDCRKNSYAFVRERDGHFRVEVLQKIKITQIQQLDSVVCVLTGELVGTVKLGDIVDITGIVEIKNDSKLSRTLAFQVDANHVRVLNETTGGFASSFIGPHDFDPIQNLSSRKHVFPMLVNSILPKSSLTMAARAMLLLFMFSTRHDPFHLLFSRRFDDIESYASINPHCILFDETSRSSLVSTKNKDKFKAGTFVTANSGTIIVSDIDRFRAAQLTYLETLETGYERVDSFHCVPTTFSSIILGSPKLIDESVMDVFSAVIEVGENKKDVRRATPRPQSSAGNGFEKWDDKFLPITERLVGRGEAIAPADLRKYLAYAKQFVKPKWGSSAHKRLEEVANTVQDIRKIKNIVQCRARCELRDSISEGDVDDVAELLIIANEGFRPKKGPTVNSRQKIISDFMAEFLRLSKYKEDAIVTEQEIFEIAEMLGVKSKFVSIDNFVNILSMNNYILSSGPRKYRPGTAAL